MPLSIRRVSLLNQEPVLTGLSDKISNALLMLSTLALNFFRRRLLLGDKFSDQRGSNRQMRDYHLHEQNESGFESLTLTIASKILGIGVTGFSSGPDGGRDGRFVGTASHYPSATTSWKGKWIVQAKHTENPIATCSDSGFISTFEKEEIPRIKALVANDELDIYLLITNRRKSGGADQKLRTLLRSALDHDNFGVHGGEDLARWLDGHVEIVHQFELNRHREPLRFSPSDLAGLIEAFSEEKPDYLAASQLSGDFDLTKFEEKNELNKVSDELAESIEDDSMPYFEKIEEFLKSPKNDQYRLMYYALTNELKQKLISENATELGIALAFSEIYDVVVGRHPELTNRKRLVTVFLHYMYYTCDIGRKRDRRRQAP
jgi:hypothetical protein